MLLESVTLWPGGPSVTVDDYFVYVKYAFSILLFIWVAGILRWPGRRWLLGGALFLAAFSWTALDRPLGRPYGLTEDHRGVFELAQPMVAAARGTAGESWMVREGNPRPFWSLVLGTLSGFDPGRVLAVYPWIPLATLLFFGLGLYWGLGGASDEAVARALAVFVALFLCSHRLSILQSPGPLWTYLFWLQPRLGFAMGLLFIWFRLLGHSRNLSGFSLAGVVLGLVALTEPILGLYGAAAALLWTLCVRRSLGGVSLSFALTLGIFLLGGGRLEPVSLPEGGRSWHELFNHFLSLTLDKGLVFYLGGYALYRGIRGRDAELPALAWAAGFFLWIASCLSARASSWLHPELLHAYLQVLLAAAAGLGAYRALVWTAERLETTSELRWSPPSWIRGRPFQTLGVACFTALSLPWCFPYWWHAPRMDPVYAASYQPVSRQLLGLGNWVRSATDADSVFVAGPSYAPWIPALGGRRVLFVDASPSPPRDLVDRKRAQSWFAESKDRVRIEAVTDEWGITHFAWGRLDQQDLGVDYEFFRSSPLFVECYRLRRWVRVFEVQSR